MTQPGPETPFSRDRVIDKPGIMGARWWHASLNDEASKVARRSAMKTLLIVGGVIAGAGVIATLAASGGDSGTTNPVGTIPSDASESRKTALDMQKTYGWDFGAVGEALVFDGVSSKPFEPGALGSLATDLAPTQRELLPYFQSTLFDAPYAVAKSPPPTEDATPSKPLATAVQPISTTAMNAAYGRGRSLASLFASLAENGGKPTDATTGLVVDLPGPEAVAFAAGAAAVFDPVFLFDNWPHPRGVVRAQEALSAAAYYQPLFAAARKAAGTGSSAAKRPPMFVLDRRRITAYADDATQFDNRYVAKLPNAGLMKVLGAAHVIYVVPTRSDTTVELDDLNDDFVALSTAGVEVKALSLDMFQAPGSDAGDMRPPGANATNPAGSAAAAESDRLLETGGWAYYGGSRTSHHAFFTDYPWARPARAASMRPSNPGRNYRPTARSTTFSSGSTSGTSSASSRPRPTNFGTVPVLIAVGTGVILGSRYSRSGSWNRASGGWGG